MFRGTTILYFCYYMYQLFSYFQRVFVVLVICVSCLPLKSILFKKSEVVLPLIVTLGNVFGVLLFVMSLHYFAKYSFCGLFVVVPFLICMFGSSTT